jgi:excinuclease UvrABC ATPase subunit
MYILDEPSIGLHQRDNQRLLATLKQLRDLGNTVIVVEHDEEAIRAADHVIDLGPGAGAHGGHLVAQGTPADIETAPASITGQYLSGRRRIALPTLRMRPDPARQITVVGARGNNLKNVSVPIPLGLFTCVTGVSGSGKSTLVIDTLFAHAAKRLSEALHLFTLAPSLGGVESLVSIPVLTSHAMISADLRQKMGVTEQLIRLSVGIENAGDLIADLEQALTVVSPASQHVEVG